MCIFSEYRDIFGEPRKGIHSIRFMDVAIIDFILTIVLAFLISYIFNIPFILILIILLILGVLLHYLFGVNTNTLIYFGTTCN